MSTVPAPANRRLVALTVAVVLALLVPVVAAAVHAVKGDGASTDADPASSRPSVSRRPTASPQDSGTPSASPSSAGSVSCWDGSSAGRVADCSEPQGADGLAWVFPSIADQRCGKVTSSPTDGVVARRVCRTRLDGGGGRALIVYTQWQSADQAAAYLRGKGLAPSRGAGPAGLLRFALAGPDSTKSGATYADEPFSYIATLPPGSAKVLTTGRVVKARPASQVRGARAR